MAESPTQELEQKVLSSEVSNESYDPRQETLSLLKDAEKILQLFKLKGNNEDYYRIEESYDELIKSYKKALEDNKIETKNSVNGLKTEIQDIREKGDDLKKMIGKTSFNYLHSIDYINTIKISEMDDVKLESIFTYLKDNPNNIYFITNKEFIIKFLSYKEDNNSNYGSYSFYYSNLSPRLQSDSSIILTYIKFSKEKSLSSIPGESIKSMIDSFDDNVDFKTLLFEFYTNKSLLKNLTTKVLSLNNDNTTKKLLEILTSYLHEDSLSLIPKNIIIKFKDYILNLFNELGPLDISAIEARLSEKNQEFTINSENIDFQSINIYIEENGLTEDIKPKVIELIKKGYFGNLESLHYNKNFILELISIGETPNIIQYFTQEIKSDKDIIKSIVKGRDSIDYLYLLEIKEPETLFEVYNVLRTKEISPKVIFANDKFRDQTESFINDKKLDDSKFSTLRNDFFESEEFFAQRYLSINTLVLSVRKRDIINLLIKEYNFEEKNAENLFALLLNSSLSIDSLRTNFKEIGRYFIKGEKDIEGVNKLKSFFEKLTLFKLETIKDESLTNGYFGKILETVDIKLLTKENSKLSTFVTGNMLDLNKIKSDFVSYKSNNKQKKGEGNNEYEYRIINQYIDTIFNKEGLSLNEGKAKYVFTELIKNIFYEKKVENEYKFIKTNPDLFIKYISTPIDSPNSETIENEYRKITNQTIPTPEAQDIQISDNTLIPEITKTQNGYNFTTTTQAGEKLELPITPYEANLINGNKEIKENFKKFSETLSDLNLLNLWTYREGIFKAISEIKGIAFNANDDFLKEEEVKLFLVSVISSISNNLSLEQQQKIGVNPSFDSELIDSSYIKNKKLSELKTEIRNINVIGKGKDSATGYSPIENAFIKVFTNESNRGQFLQDKFKQYI